MDVIHVGDIGTEVIGTFTNRVTGAAIDISDADLMVLTLRRPNGTSFQRSLSLYTDGLDGQAVYIAQAGDWDIHGLWQSQSFVRIPGVGEFTSDVDGFRVMPPL